MGKKMQGQIIQWPKKTQGQTIQWAKKNIGTDNTMAKRKIQGQTIQWPKKYIGTDNTMVKKIYRDRQYIGQKYIQGQTIQWPKKKRRRQTMIYKTLYRSPKTEQHEAHKPGVNSGTPLLLAVRYSQYSYFTNNFIPSKTIAQQDLFYCYTISAYIYHHFLLRVPLPTMSRCTRYNL